MERLFLDDELPASCLSGARWAYWRPATEGIVERVACMAAMSDCRRTSMKRIRSHLFFPEGAGYCAKNPPVHVTQDLRAAMVPDNHGSPDAMAIASNSVPVR